MKLKYSMRLLLLSFTLLAGFFLLLARLWTLQIEKNQEYKDKLPGVRHVKVRVPGVRGEIKDRNGLTLVSNEASYEVHFSLGIIVDAYREKHGDLPKIDLTYQDGGVERTREEVDIVKIVNELVISPLESMGLAVPYSSRQLQVHFRSFSQGLVPWTYRRDLTFDEFAVFAEHHLGLPGVSVAVRPRRRYDYDALASHILGYVKLPDIQKVSLDERKEWDFYLGDDYGVHGIEKSMDEHLRGKPGIRTLLKDEKGAIVGEVDYQEPQKGADIYLTIDARLQLIAEKALRDSGIGRGSAVVLDPWSGDILAMASIPSFNPNKFIPSISQTDWDGYRTNATRPLVNRSIKDYAPGSTFKIPVSFAAYLKGKGSPRLVCNGGVQFGRKFMRCWIHSLGSTHGSINLSDAIMHSCNAYYYQYGNQVGIKQMEAACKMFGLGEASGIELEGEDSGVVPGPIWLKVQRPGTVWTPALSALTAIGQGDVEATPLQIAGVAAAVANRGRCYQKRIVHRIVNSNGETVRSEVPLMKFDLTEEGISPHEIETIRRGMWKVINGDRGTARGAKLEGVEVAGKTGTAQFKRKGQPDNHAWFMSFAPYDQPKFAICVLVEGGKSGGGVAAPISTRIMEEALAMDRGYEIFVAKLQEEEGSFHFTEKVDFPERSPLDVAIQGVVDGDVGGVVDSRSSDERVLRGVPVEPTITPEADTITGRGGREQTPVRRATIYRPSPYKKRF